MADDLRADFSRLEIVHTDELEWADSPSPHVLRKRLERMGPVEAGRVTSVVRYQAGSDFPSHAHPDGEEIFVLDGVFSDEHGDYPAGTYLLNPEGFSHAPFSKGGCTLFVKLRQYGGEGRKKVVLDTRQETWDAGPHDGVRFLQLYRQRSFPEEMRLVRLERGVEIPEQRFDAGEEIFVLHGELIDEHGRYREGTWVRYPPGSVHTPRTKTGCTFYVKKGHLAQA